MLMRYIAVVLKRIYATRPLLLSTTGAVPPLFLPTNNNVMFFLAEPLPLTDICRRAIRRHICNASRVEDLNLPPALKQYLLYQ